MKGRRARGRTELYGSRFSLLVLQVLENLILGGMKMKKYFLSVVAFFRTLRSCIETAARDTEAHYHIPKSRFRDSGSAAEGLPASAKTQNYILFSRFFNTFGNCISQAWKECESQYHIPKTRFRDNMAGRPGFTPMTANPVSTSKESDFIGSGTWTVQPGVQPVESKPGITAEVADDAGAGIDANTSNLPRLES